MTIFAERRVRRSSGFDPSATALLVVDMLNDFLDPEGAMPLPEGRTLYAPIKRLLDSCRSRGVPVIWICDEHPPNDREFEKRAVHCLAGEWGARIVDDLDPRDDEDRIPKRRYSGFFDTTLEERLGELGIRHLIIAGVVTNICVRSTAHDAFFRDFDVIVPRDCVAATSEREQESSLYDIDTHYGTVSDLDDVLSTLDSPVTVIQRRAT